MSNALNFSTLHPTPTPAAEVMSVRTSWRCCPESQIQRLLRPQCPRSTILPPYCYRAFRVTSSQLRVPSQPRTAHDEAIHHDNPKPTNLRLNPPASTRPPPLTLPQRSSFSSTPQYLFALSKGYLRFYKDGVKALWANWKLLKAKLEQLPPQERPSILRPGDVPRSWSRADWVLLWRVRHDLARLPLFALMLIVIGEWLAVVVLYVDGVVPYTCRIPKQQFQSLETAEARRKAAFQELDVRFPQGVLSPGLTQGVARSHVLRSLHLTGHLWDRMGGFPPGMWAMKGKARLAFLESDDSNLVNDKGPMGLDYEELRIACSERGIDILGKTKNELTDSLANWLRLVSAQDMEERRRRMAFLLLTRSEHWPQQRSFSLPDWKL